MAHSIRAIVGPLEVIQNVIHAAGSPPATELTCGMTIIPLGEAQIDKLTGGGSRELVSGFGFLTLGLERALAPLATRGAFAFIETEYFGGSGGQAAAVFNPGLAPVRFTDEQEPNPINLALKLLGVPALDAADEFDTLGLGRFRRLEALGLENDWVRGEPSNATPTPAMAPAKARQRSQRRTAAALILSAIALAALVVMFWIALTLLTNTGFDFALPT